MRINFVVFALATMDRSHIKVMSKDKGYLFASTEIGESVQAEHAFGADNNVIAEWLYCVQENFWIGLNIFYGEQYLHFY